MNAKGKYRRPAGLNDDLHQLSLGDLIEQLAPIPLMHERWGDEPPVAKIVRFDFTDMAPIYLHSYRGFYHELSITPTEDYGKRLTLEKFRTLLKEAVGKSFCGWKGGEYVMREDTPVWVAKDGQTSETAIVGVVDKGCEVVLHTAWCES